MGRPWGRSGSPLARRAALQMLISTQASKIQDPGLRTVQTVYDHLARSTQKGSARRSINQIRLPRCQVCAERLRPGPTGKQTKEHNQTIGRSA